jgi:hypothetical protein
VLLATIPALESAACDPRLSVTDRAVVLWAYHTPLLSIGRFQPLKVVTVHELTRTKRAVTIRAIHHLTACGYLERAADAADAPAWMRAERRPQWYRLAYRVVVPKTP